MNILKLVILVLVFSISLGIILGVIGEFISLLYKKIKKSKKIDKGRKL